MAIFNGAGNTLTAATATTPSTAAPATTSSTAATATTPSWAVKAPTWRSSAPATTCSSGIRATAMTRSTAAAASTRSTSSAKSTAARPSSCIDADGSGGRSSPVPTATSISPVSSASSSRLRAHADNITINDLTGTGVKQVAIDLGAGADLTIRCDRNRLKDHMDWGGHGQHQLDQRPRDHVHRQQRRGHGVGSGQRRDDLQLRGRRSALHQWPNPTQSPMAKPSQSRGEQQQHRRHLDGK